MAKVVYNTWWEGYWGKTIRDIYSVLLPTVALLIWEQIMAIKVPADKEAMILSLAFVIVRSFDRRVRDWIVSKRP